MFISHDLGTVRAISDEIMVMYAGQVVELSRREALAQAPMHPYSELLAASVPELRQGWLDDLEPKFLAEASAAPPRAGAVATCAFFGRCAIRIDGVCDVDVTPVRKVAKGASLRCCHSEADLVRLQSASNHSHLSAAHHPVS
jgi:peptide/nickel transport system ATP-binding protein